IRMTDWFSSLFDTSDLYTVIIVLVVGIAGYWYMNQPDPRTSRKHELRPLNGGGSSQARTPAYTDEGFAARLKNEHRDILIIYGSQTGTAEELSGRLSKNFTRYGRKSLVLDPEEVEEDEWNKLAELDSVLLVLCMATYGEGDPTDNAQKLIEWIKTSDVDLSKLKYAVFGLGNKTYEHYNEIGKICDRRLEELGAKRVIELGLGDDDANLEEDFCKWRDVFLPTAASSFGWELDPEAESARQYRLQLVETTPDRLYSGEFGRLNSHVKPRPPFDQKTPFFATIKVNRELHTEKSDRSCRHMEFDLGTSMIRYEAGDHLGVYPTNETSLVDKMCSLLDFNPTQAFKLINLDEESNKKHPFPCPTTFRVALAHYVDISAPVKAHVLKAIAEFASDEEQKKKLVLMSNSEGEGHTLFNEYVTRERRSIVDILSEFSSCKPSIDLVLELLPRLQVRYYSISSSPKAVDKSVHITAVVTQYKIGERQINGVCTTFLRNKEVGDTVPIFVRKSTMRMSYNDSQTVVMIGPGTGIAPFRGFIQERKVLMERGTVGGGNFVLFFGCRHPEIDFIYKDELEQYKKDGVLSHLFTAFSREGPKKVYVQDKLVENEDLVYAAYESGYVLVCGDAKNMARDVQQCLIKMISKKESVSEEEAQAKFKVFEKSRRYLADVW
ncbi:hypothetical protein PMAYCL1PPCAC_12743, partial [Pristionchus mayeri]